MNAFDENHTLPDRMHWNEYFPDFPVHKATTGKEEIQKAIVLPESGEAGPKPFGRSRMR